MGYDERAPQPPLRQFGGLNVRDSEIGLPGNDSPYLINVDLHPDDSLKGRMGCISLTTPTDETKIEAVMHLEQPEDGEGWLYCVAGGKVYRTAEPGTWAWSEVTCATPVVLVAQTSWGRETSRYNDGTTEYPNVMYLPRSNGAPHIAIGQTNPVLDLILMPEGELGSDIPDSGTTGYPEAWRTPVADWPTHMRIIGVGKGAQMHAWGFPSNKSKIAYSELDVPWNFLRRDVDYPSHAPQSAVDGGSWIARPGAGGEVTAVVDMYGYTVVFKRKRTLVYTGAPGTDGHEAIADFPVGCVSDRAWKKVGNDILFWSEDGPRSLSAVQEYGDVQQNNLAWKINPLVKQVLPGSYERICCYHDPEHERMIWFTPISLATHNDNAFVYYYRSGKLTRWDGQYCEMMDVTQLTPNSANVERIIGASFENGLIQLQSGYSDLATSVDVAADDTLTVGDAMNIENDYYTNWINYGNISDATRALWFEALFGDLGTGVDIYYQSDLDDTWYPISRLLRSFGGTGLAWGLFAWGSAAWGDTGRAFRRYELDQLFNMIRFRFHKAGKIGWEAMAYRVEARTKGGRT